MQQYGCYPWSPDCLLFWSGCRRGTVVRGGRLDVRDDSWVLHYNFAPRLESGVHQLLQRCLDNRSITATHHQWRRGDGRGRGGGVMPQTAFLIGVIVDKGSQPSSICAVSSPLPLPPTQSHSGLKRLWRCSWNAISRAAIVAECAQMNFFLFLPFLLPTAFLCVCSHTVTIILACLGEKGIWFFVVPGASPASEGSHHQFLGCCWTGDRVALGKQKHAQWKDRGEAKIRDCYKKLHSFLVSVSGIVEARLVHFETWKVIESLDSKF